MARVFISSTTEDLNDHRAAANAALRRLQHEPIQLEHLSADAYNTPYDQSRALIDSCDLFIGLVAWRYGYIPDRDNPDRRSFVELEHRYAWDHQKPTLVFMVRDDAPWPPPFFDRGEPGQRQEQFRREVKSRVVVSFFTTPDDLAREVELAVSRWRPAKRTPPPIPPGVDGFELAWRLVVDLQADPALLRHIDLDRLDEAIEQWARASGAAELDASQQYTAAQEQLRKKQPALAPHPLWLAWIAATTTSVQPKRHA